MRRCQKELYNEQSDDAVYGCYESELCVWVSDPVSLQPFTALGEIMVTVFLGSLKQIYFETKVYTSHTWLWA